MRRAGRALRFGPTRRALVRRGAAIAIALASGWWVQSAVAEAARLRDHWDPTTRVVVAEVPLRAGQPVRPGHLRVESRPRSLVPAGAITELPDTSLDAEVDVPAGEVLLSDRLGGADDPTQIPGGHVALAVEPAGALPPAAPGDRVDLLAASPPDTYAGALSSEDGGVPGAGSFRDAPEAVVVANDAIVIAASDLHGGESGDGASARSVTLAVAERHSAAAAAAILAGPVTIALRPG